MNTMDGRENMADTSASHDERRVWERYPDADIDHDNRSLYEGWLSHELRIPQCADCGRWHQPSRAICPFCWSFNVVPTPVSGNGRVTLAIILSQGRTAPGVTYPYPVVTVELEEQPALRFTTTIIDCDLADVRIGMDVELAWTQRAGAPFPVFRPRTPEVR